MQVTDLAQDAAARFRAPNEAGDLSATCHELIELGAQFIQLDGEVHDVTVEPDDRQQRRGADDVGDLRLVVGTDAPQHDGVPPTGAIGSKVAVVETVCESFTGLKRLLAVLAEAAPSGEH